MALIPTMLLRKLYTNNSLKNTAGGVQFAIKNRLSDAELTELQSVSIAGRQVPRSALTLDLGDGNALAADQISSGKPVAFPLGKTLLVNAAIDPLPHGKYSVEIAVKTK